jgi:serine/threonine protein kinase/Tol biopolymer transport system component
MAEPPVRFGPYEIVGPLGAGGMGQVYRGRDTRLQRFVAIKVLQEAAAFDPTRQRRFAQEALAASALNHPNILTVFDVGTEGETQYLVSELIDGDSLRSEMNRGRVALKRLLDVALQIADGLAAAHEAGIVHRDLKPENVMVTGDGRVKIVDFGLAKTPEVEPALGGGPSATQTADGLIMGTVPYMSPEQARGGPADFRSDQFALGVMLYEMATATHPFRRETAVQTLSAIVADEPPDVGEAAPSLPVPVRWLVRRLLSKAPRERYAHTADLAAELRTIRSHLSEATLATASITPVRPRRWLLLAAGATLVAAGLLIVTVLAPRQALASFDRFTPFATDPGYQGAPTWSPDGKQIAYQAEVNGVIQIFVRTPGSPTRTQITNSRFDCYISAWSPADGTIYYHSAAHEADGLWRVSPVSGARPEIVIENASQSAILADGKTIYFLRDPFGEGGMATTLWRKTLPDGKEERYTRGDFGKRVGSSGLLRLSPDGSHLLVWMGTAGAGGTRADFWDIPMPDGEPRVVMPGISRAGLAPPFFTWLTDNRHVLVTRSDGSTPGNHLWVIDTHDTAAAGPAPRSSAYPLTTTPGNESSPSTSPDGRTIAFTWDATDFDLFEVPIDGSPLKPFRRSTRNEYDPAVAPGTTQYAFVTDQTGNLQIWRENQEGYLRQPIVTEADFVGPPSMAIGSLAFSPDGTKLAFQRADTAEEDPRAVGFRIWIAPVSGGKPVPVASEGTYQDAPTWSPDGSSIAFVTTRGNQPLVVKTDVGANAPPTILISEHVPGFLARPQWSPDGKWILCETLDGLTIVTPNGANKQIISDRGWLTYAWDRDSRRIFGLRPTDDSHDFMFVSLDLQTREERVINPRLGAIPQALQPIRGFSRLNSGGFLTSIASVKSDIYLIEGFRLPGNWWDRLRRWGRP